MIEVLRATSISSTVLTCQFHPYGGSGERSSSDVPSVVGFLTSTLVVAQIHSRGGVSSRTRVGPWGDSSFQQLRLSRVRRPCRSVRSLGVLVPSEFVSLLRFLIWLLIVVAGVELAGRWSCFVVGLGHLKFPTNFPTGTVLVLKESNEEDKRNGQSASNKTGNVPLSIIRSIRDRIKNQWPPSDERKIEGIHEASSDRSKLEIVISYIRHPGVPERLWCIGRPE